jgi:hypothetical protein
MGLELALPEPIWLEPGCELGTAFPGAVPTEGELGWAADGVGCGFVGPVPPDPALGAGAVLLPEPVVWATTGPARSAIMLPSATYVSHRVLIASSRMALRCHP